MADVFARLATGGAPDRNLERLLKEQQTERDEALKGVGEALLVWLATGGQLVDGDGEAAELESQPLPSRGPVSRGPSTRGLALPPADDDTGETVFAGVQSDPPTITRRRRRASLPPDPDSLKTLAENFGASGEQTQFTDAISSIKAFMDAVGTPEPPSTPLEFLDGIQRLARVSDRTDRWKRLPRRVQQIFLAYCTCKARVWQENLDLGSSRHEVVLEQVFRALTRYSARERPGFVHGLSRTHRAERETWADDAEYWWTELALAADMDPEPSNAEKQLEELSRTLSRPVSDGVVQAAVVHAIENGVQPGDLRLLKLLNTHTDALEDEPRLRAVRRALRDQDTDNEDLTEEAPLIDPDWPWMHVTEGKTAVIAGGDARPEATERARAAFHFEEVTWHADPNDRRLDSLVQRIRSGKVGMLFFLARFSSHGAQSALRDACKESGVPFVRIEHGYGVQQMKLAIESWMHGKQ
ncbi:MAG: 2-hydroxyacyl-CoA dehydratase [Alphaproteobacteria bacterium]|nr:2-hydroxyacyl-CoA dehydratase [Alphaproteobacteria bacterium]